METGEEIENRGFTGPHILLPGVHPFDPEGGGYVACPESAFPDEGIAALNTAGEEGFTRALASAGERSHFVEPFPVRFDARVGDRTLEEFRGGSFREFARSPSKLT